jgi:hypothetical protein
MLQHPVSIRQKPNQAMPFRYVPRVTAGLALLDSVVFHHSIKFVSAMKFPLAFFLNARRYLFRAMLRT